MVNIQIKKLNDKAVIPSKGSKDAACYDLVITEIIEETPNKVTVKYGIATAIPKGYKCVITPRSSFTHKGWLMANSCGIIDADYRGEWMSKFEAIPTKYVESFEQTSPSGALYYNAGYLDNKEFPYQVGDRVTQFSIEKVIPSEISVVDELSDTERGEGGFGSTGS